MPTGIAGLFQLRVSVSPNVDAKALQPGQEVMLNESMNVVAVRSFEDIGEFVDAIREMQGPPLRRKT